MSVDPWNGGWFDADLRRTIVGRDCALPGRSWSDRGPRSPCRLAWERIEEVLRAIAEDAFSPGLVETPPWHDESAFTDDLLAAIHEIADTTDRLLAERMTHLLETAPADLAGRLAAAPRISDPT